MAGRATYTDQQKAEAFALLEVNEGNIKRTARDLGLPASTIRRWRDDWNADKNLPSIEDIAQVTGNFLNDAERVRDLALRELERKLPNATAAQLVTVVGVLDDKIARAKGINDRVVEHKLTLPSPDAIRETLLGLQQAGLQAARLRDEEIVDAEVVEQKALSA
jgi:transposase-like protein